MSIANEGIVLKADKNSIQIKTKKGFMPEYDYTPNPKVFINGKEARPEDVKVDDNARVYITRSSGGPWKAYKVEIVRK